MSKAKELLSSINERQWIYDKRKKVWNLLDTSISHDIGGEITHPLLARIHSFGGIYKILMISHSENMDYIRLTFTSKEECMKYVEDYINNKLIIPK